MDYLPHFEVIDAEAFGEPWGRTRWLVDLPGKWELSWVLLCKGRPIGFLIASRKEDALHIHRLAVAANERCTGFGNLLMTAAARQAQEQGYPIITLKVRHTNTRAIAFYTRLGFTVSGRQRDNLEMIGNSRQIFNRTQSV